MKDTMDEKTTPPELKLSWLTRVAMMLGLGQASHAMRHSMTREQLEDEFENVVRQRIPDECRDGDILPLLFYPDPMLKTPSATVKVFNEDLRLLVKAMGATMYMTGGVGLSAIQVGVPLRVFVADMRDLHDQKESKFRVFVNPVVLDVGYPEEKMVEGCLSIPNVREQITRPSTVHLCAETERGQTFDAKLTGWPARIFLHEMEHLEGGLFIDNVSGLARRMIEKRAAKLRKSVKLDEINGKRHAVMRNGKGRGR